jgi:hypothetical protein
MRNILTQFRNIFSYDLVYLNNLLNNIDYPINSGVGILHFFVISDKPIYYIELYDYLSRIEVVDEVINRCELIKACGLYPNTDYQFLQNSMEGLIVDFIKTTIYEIDFPTWLIINDIPNISKWKYLDMYVPLLEEYIVIRYRSIFRNEILNDLINR